MPRESFLRKREKLEPLRCSGAPKHFGGGACEA